MRQIQVEGKDIPKIKETSPPPPPPPPPPLPSRCAAKSLAVKRIAPSVTNQEIAKFWRQKRMEEEDHFLCAIKAAARIRARMLSEEDYKRFEESLMDSNADEDGCNKSNDDKNDENDKELCVGVKDWWTKSKYAYLNQPAIESMDAPKRSSTYIPNFCCFKLPSLQPTSFRTWKETLVLL